MISYERLASVTLLAIFSVAACSVSDVNVNLKKASDAGTKACLHTSECPSHEVCVFAKCSTLCEGDRDCPGGRCLATKEDGNACVTADVKCPEQTCPAGSICTANGTCRNQCGPADAGSCLLDQSCTVEKLCVGQDTKHDPEAGHGTAGTNTGGGTGSAGPFGAGGAQGTGGTTGSAGGGVPAGTGGAVGGTAGTAGASGATGAGGSGGLQCSTACSSGTPHCDTSRGVCVECVSNPDCAFAAGRTVCHTASNACVQCVDDTTCGTSTPSCNTVTHTCVPCLEDTDCGAGGACLNGNCVTSCQGVAPACGPSSNETCCASSLIPGGTFRRSYDGVTYDDQTYPATVSDFRLDKYEITVGRFRNFVAAYSQTMIAAAAGKNPNDPTDTGWDPAWDMKLPMNSAMLLTDITCGGTKHTWTAAAGANEGLPMNCIDWYEAFAFCVWDGGRLPTEAEWNYAAAGGAQQRVYPWSSPANSTALDCTDATYAGCGTSPTRAGSKSPNSDGRWGHADLAGNVSEWTLDASSSYSNPCTNCASLTMPTMRVLRGGSLNSAAPSILTSYRSFLSASENYNGSADFGSRCARTP